MIGPEWSVCESNTVDRKFYRLVPRPVRRTLHTEGEGFEPPVPFDTSVFKTDAISQTRPTFYSETIILSNNLFLFSRSDTDRTCVVFIPNEVPEPLGYAPILFMRPNVILFCILIALLFNVQISPLSIAHTYNKSCSCE